MHIRMHWKQGNPKLFRDCRGIAYLESYQLIYTAVVGNETILVYGSHPPRHPYINHNLASTWILVCQILIHHKCIIQVLGICQPTLSCRWKLCIEGILPKGPHPPCVSMAGRALLAGYPWYQLPQTNLFKIFLKQLSFGITFLHAYLLRLTFADKTRNTCHNMTGVRI